jgi:hypothetical protein
MALHTECRIHRLGLLSLFVSAALFAIVPHARSEPAQESQDNIAQAIRSGTPLQRVGAINRAYVLSQRIGVARLEARLRDELIRALESEGRKMQSQYEAAKAGDTSALYSSEDVDPLGPLVRIVPEMRYRGAIPAMVASLGSGMAVVHGLTALSPHSAEAVLNTVLSPTRMYDAVNDGLIALRIMVELQGARPLPESTLRRMHQAAEHHLTVPAPLAETGVTLRRAIDLAIALKDPKLRAVVEALAKDGDAVTARGVVAPDLIKMTQKWASDRLAGVLPLPRPQPPA